MLLVFLCTFTFGQTSQVISLPQSVVPFGFNGSLDKPRLQTFRSSIIYNPVTYSLPQTFLDAFPNGQIDFGDGNGFVAIGSQTTRSINYPSFSEKNIRIKFSDANGEVIKTLTSINVKQQIAPYVKPDEVWTVNVQSGVNWTRPTSCANAYPTGSTLVNTEQTSVFNGNSIGAANARSAHIFSLLFKNTTRSNRSPDRFMLRT